MKIEKVNFNEQKFQDLLFDYYLKSFPYGDANSMKSLSSRLDEAKNLVDILKASDLSIYIKELEEFNFFTFFVKTNNKINLKFAFPNLSMKMHPNKMVLVFYKLLLYAFDFFSVSEIYGEIERVHKKNNYANWLKRYLAVKYVESDGEEYDKVYFNKDKVLKHHEQLQAKSNRDKSGDQKS